jgi:hypothetical protein
MEITTKLCPSCDGERSLKEFNKDKSTEGGLTWNCRPCILATREIDGKRIPFAPNYTCTEYGHIQNDKGEFITSHLSHGYPRVTLRTGGQPKSYYVHCIVAELFVENPDPENKIEVDHWDHNRLHNHYSNLRWVSKSENVRSRRKRRNTSSQYMGVSRDTRISKWTAHYTKDGQYKYIGSFDDEEEAARAWDEKMIEEFGEGNVRLNFTDDVDNQIDTMPETNYAIREGFDDDSGNFMTYEEYPKYRFYENQTIKNMITGEYVRGRYDMEGYRLVALENRSGRHINKHFHVVFMACFKPDKTSGLVIDHVNGNRKDNSLENLRRITESANSRNKPKRKGCTSQYYGVHFKDNKWVARIIINKERIYIGAFETEEEAAHAYDVLELLEFPDEPKLNFPIEYYNNPKN